MNENNAWWSNPSELLAIGETLNLYRRTIVFKQYNSGNPAKCSLLYRNLCGFVTTYTYSSLPCAVKLKVAEGPASNYVTGTNNYTKYLFN